MRFGDRVYAIVGDTLYPGKIMRAITLRGVVTGYEVAISTNSVNLVKKFIFTDEEEAKKALFMKKLKDQTKDIVVPSEDIKGERHWIAGYRPQRR